MSAVQRRKPTFGKHGFAAGYKLLIDGGRELSSPTVPLCRKLPPHEASVRSGRSWGGGGRGTDTSDFEATLITADQDRTIATTRTNDSEGLQGTLVLKSNPGSSA